MIGKGLIFIMILGQWRRDINLALFVRPSVTNLFRLYLKDYYRFEHETSAVYRSH